MNHEQATALLNRELARARQAIALERLTPVLAPVVLAIGLWAGLALLGFPDLLTPLMASLVTIAVLVLIVALAIRGLRTWRRPTMQDARGRLARDGGMEPAALDALEDQPSRLDPSALVLWEREQ
jgi:Domain of unknown function (DUF4175)